MLAEFATTSGTFTEVTRRLLAKLRQSPGSRMSYVYDQHVFHYKMDDNLIFLCLADEVPHQPVLSRMVDSLVGSLID